HLRRKLGLRLERERIKAPAHRIVIEIRIQKARGGIIRSPHRRASFDEGARTDHRYLIVPCRKLPKGGSSSTPIGVLMRRPQTPPVSAERENANTQTQREALPFVGRR